MWSLASGGEVSVVVVVGIAMAVSSVVAWFEVQMSIENLIASWSDLG